MNIGQSLIAILLRPNSQMTYFAFRWTEKDLAKRTMLGPPTVLGLSNKTDFLCCIDPSSAEVSPHRERSDSGPCWPSTRVSRNATPRCWNMTLLTSRRCNNFFRTCGVMDTWVVELLMF